MAARISEDEDFMNELSRLAASFGMIELDLEDPHSSDVILPAKYKKDLDFETMNKLAINSDFKDFIETVKIDLKSKKIHKKEYDVVEKIENL